MTIMRPIPSALVKFKTPLFGTITNTADLGGDIAVIGKKQQQECCITPLLNRSNNQRINWTGDWCNILAIVPKYT